MIRLALNLIRVYAILSRALHPRCGPGDDDRHGLDDWTWPADIHAAMRALPAGHGFACPENLFRKITDEERTEWQARFSGVRD
jgi:methionyl-tRNA synthetase